MAPPEPSLLEKLQRLLNAHSKENGSDTPDFILAEFLLDSLEAFDRATKMRSRWYDHRPWGDDSAWLADDGAVKA